ncbi:class II aldolase/adducin family protein, partial [Glaesserella parasuis]|nr:class II aldolase/adducin family protein [Glaesserella parasuis]MCT8615351.1 class II aldolase/adducin family protein [Glaesserella parasuis]MCT8617296.1 class II aldolase/adducin family protein [Glaesserella parasuis]MCT8630318.1 class II aldolase/adducin family protein [Glaesserella parasuis]MCT8658023.1 class II aldolase/adducin family protein [Glaesserella parasuis]
MNRQTLARKIIDTCLEMTRLGLNQGTAGNISVRYQDGMLITPSGMPYEKMTEDD